MALSARDARPQYDSQVLWGEVDSDRTRSVLAMKC